LRTPSALPPRARRRRCMSFRCMSLGPRTSCGDCIPILLSCRIVILWNSISKCFPNGNSQHSRHSRPSVLQPRGRSLVALSRKPVMRLARAAPKIAHDGKADAQILAQVPCSTLVTKAFWIDGVLLGAPARFTRRNQRDVDPLHIASSGRSEPKLSGGKCARAHYRRRRCWTRRKSATRTRPRPRRGPTIRTGCSEGLGLRSISPARLPAPDMFRRETFRSVQNCPTYR
jgi:hypothetical protein